MNANLTPTSSMVRRGRMAVAVLAAAMALAAGCGSDDTATTNTAKPAGAKENTTTAVCTDWMDTSATPKVVTCAVGARGPGGGRIFYDADSQQPWGRFLEVAPQKWNVNLFDCPGSGLIGSACDSTDKDRYPKQTSDIPQKGAGWYPCTADSPMMSSSDVQRLIDPAAQKLGTAIGTGKDNTAAILAAGQCTVANSSNTDARWSAFQKAANYRGGGLSDWFIGSKDELVELCKYTGRNDIGGFPGEDSEWRYLSSSTSITKDVRARDITLWSQVFFGPKGCEVNTNNIAYLTGRLETSNRLVRPIRAF